jgi:2-keto-4-pentenoate hydratase/2-oxohepta-3-ene-1,7-dioic acid hydratase in catechol pathway
MRILMYDRAGDRRLGLMYEDQVVDVHDLSRAVGLDPFEGSVLDVVRSGMNSLAAVTEILANRENLSLIASAATPFESAEVRAPLDPPIGNVIAIGRNYPEHAAESARALGREVERPTVFTKAQTSIIGPQGDVVVDPQVTSQPDWEAELGVVIGRRALNVPIESGLDYVFGYTVINDVSARDVQFGWGGQFFKGKSLDTFCPMGPWIVTTDEVPDPQDLQISLRVNGETKQDATTADMIFPVAEIVSQLSLGMTLLPGMVIATGTPSGVGFAREPKGFLKNGDLMETEVSGVGYLRNRIVYC